MLKKVILPEKDYFGYRKTAKAVRRPRKEVRLKLVDSEGQVEILAVSPDRE